MLSSGVHIAMRSNRSFLTKTFRYDADTETVIPADDSIVISDELLHAYCLYVDNKFKVSSNIVNSDYYAHVFNKEPSGGSLKDTVVFTDIKSIFNQASVLYMSVSYTHLDVYKIQSPQSRGMRWNSVQWSNTPYW